MTTPVTKIRRTRATTTVTPQIVTTAKSTPTLNSKPHTQLTKLNVQAAQVKDPVQLARVLNKIQDNSDQATLGARTNPITGGGVIVKNQSFTAGVAKLLQHNLGRAPQGAIVTSSTTTGAGSSAAYGALYNVLSDAVTMSMTTGAAFVQCPLTHAGATSGTTLTTGATGHITVASSATLAVNVAGSLEWNSNAGGDLTFAVFVNGSQAPDITNCLSPINTGSFATFNLTGVHAASAGDVFDLRIAQGNTTPNAIVIGYTNLSIAALGGVGGSSGGITVSQAPLPAGTDASTAINLVPSATGTADVMVF